MAQKPKNSAGDGVDKMLADQRAEQQRRNEEAMREMDEAQPTPTQDELDRAKLGALNVDEKEDAAPAAPEPRAAASGSAAPYQNRAAKSD